MYDIPELEKKWRKYKRNKIKKPIIISVASLAILAGVGALAYTYLNKPSSNTDSSVQNSTQVVKTAPKESAQPNGDNSAAIVITKSSQAAQSNGSSQVNNQSNSTNPLVAVKPSDSANGMVITKTTQEEPTIDLSTATIIKPNVPDDEIRVIGFDNKEKNEIKEKYSDILIPKQSTQDIQERERIAELEEKFKASQDPQDSLKIARYYYERGNYKKAENWAVNTNNIDGDLEDSWLIFAKSRAKQGFRTDAIKVLQSFYDETNSQKAKALLDNIRRGKPFN